jgi:adenine phosphoribosyltransferase
MTSSSSSSSSPLIEEYLRAKIRDIPDFPVKGILFRDITTLVADPEAFRKTIDALYDRCRDLKITKVVAVESRGYIFGSLLAYMLGCGFVPVRKPGKLPYRTIKREYTLEYGTATVEMHVDALSADDQVLVVDDLLATGGTLRATCDLVEQLGANVSCVAVVIELSFLGGQSKFEGYDYFSLVKYEDE